MRICSVKRYGQSNFEYVESWLYVAANYRNVCAHRSRFHSVKIPPYLSSIFRDLWDSQDIIMWDEIRKQHCAVSLFHSALNAKQYLSDKTVKT